MTTRQVSVGADRLDRWVAGLADRHGDPAVAPDPERPGLLLTAPDGTTATIAVPYPPFAGTSVADAVAHLTVARRVVVVAIRRAGYLVAVLDVPAGAVLASKTGRRHVQGRTAAGGWSQQRFARRRANAADELVTAVSDHVVERVLPALGPADRARVAWLVTAGDRPLVDAVLADRRLTQLRDLPLGTHLAAGTPDAALLRSLPTVLTGARITVDEPDERT